MLNFGLVLPTLNAGIKFDAFILAFSTQTIKPHRFIVIDSSSTDETVAKANDAGAEVIKIERRTFNHGATRMLGAQMVAGECDVVVFMTQDAILANSDALEKLLKVFEDPAVQAAYGRQLPHVGAGPVESFVRLHNYPPQSERRTQADIPRLGFKACFCSNSFAAYRAQTLVEIGGFPSDCIFGEDSLAVAKMLINGAEVVYVADAQVYHSHNYTISEEFRRYFDIGVMHSRAKDLLRIFGTPTGAGRTFVFQEIAYIAKQNIFMLPEVVLRTCIKYAAYKIGKRESYLPIGLKRRISMHSRFWGE